MFDIGWSELLLIGIVALIVVGPKELPALFRTVGQYLGKARSMAREFQRSMEHAADESGIKEATKGLSSINKLDLNSATSSAQSYAKSTILGDSDAKSDALEPDSAKADASPPTDKPEVPVSADENDRAKP